MNRATLVSGVSAVVSVLWLSNGASAQEAPPQKKAPAPAVKAAPAATPNAKPALVNPAPKPAEKPVEAAAVDTSVTMPEVKGQDPLATMRALTQEQRTILVDIHRKERELESGNETVKGKLAELAGKQAELQAQLRALHESRADIYKEADPEIAKLYERQSQVRKELSEIRTKLRAAPRVGGRRPGSRPSSLHPTRVRPGTPAGPTAGPAGPPPAVTVKPTATPTAKPPPAPAPKATK